MCVEREHFQFIPNENAKNKVPEGFIEKMDIYIPHPDDY